MNERRKGVSWGSDNATQIIINEGRRRQSPVVSQTDKRTISSFTFSFQVFLVGLFYRTVVKVSLVPIPTFRVKDGSLDIGCGASRSGRTSEHV